VVAGVILLKPPIRMARQLDGVLEFNADRRDRPETVIFLRIVRKSIGGVVEPPWVSGVS